MQRTAPVTPQPMPTVELPDDLIAALSEEARARSYGDVPTFLETIVRRYLAEPPAKSLERDRLTGCLTLHELWEQIYRSTWTRSADNQAKYRERFLCVDMLAAAAFSMGLSRQV